MRWLLVPAAAAVAWFLPVSGHDAMFDWLTAWAAIHSDSSLPLDQLAAMHGVDWSDLGPHPRLPGALLLQLPFLVVPLGWAPDLGPALAAGALMWAFLEVRLPWWGWVVLAYPAANAIWYGQTSAVVTLLVALWWTRGYSWALGAATSLRIWPWFLGLARWDWRAGAWFAGLNLAGLALPGVSIAGTVDTFRSAAGEYVGRGVTAVLPWWLPVAVAVVYLWVRKPRWLVPVGLLLSPVVWLHYLTVLAVPIGKAPRRSEGLSSFSRAGRSCHRAGAAPTVSGRPTRR